MPSLEFERARDFWEPMGFVATEEPDAPYAHLPLTSDHLDIAFHRPRTLDRPMLVFRDPNMRERLARLQPEVDVDAARRAGGGHPEPHAVRLRSGSPAPCATATTAMATAISTSDSATAASGSVSRCR